MSAYVSHLTSAVIVALSVAGFTGCNSQTGKEPAAEEHHEGDGHDHTGEHYEGDGHDHSKKGAAHDHGSDAKHGHAHLTEADLEMPTDFSPAVARIKKCRYSIQEELAAGHLDEVLRPIDEATIILNKIMPIARESGVPKAKWQEINLAATDLKKRLDGLHSAIDKSGRVDFSEAAQPIDAAIRRLELVASTVPATAAGASNAR